MNYTENNKIIAEFMGAMPDKINRKPKNMRFEFPIDGTYSFPVSNLKYHTSWDWQIPVYSKAMKQMKDIITPMDADSHERKRYFQYLDKYEAAVFNNDIKAGYEILVYVLQFIKFYNQPKTT